MLLSQTRVWRLNKFAIDFRLAGKIAESEHLVDGGLGALPKSGEDKDGENDEVEQAAAKCAQALPRAEPEDKETHETITSDLYVGATESLGHPLPFASLVHDRGIPAKG